MPFDQFEAVSTKNQTDKRLLRKRGGAEEDSSDGQHLSRELQTDMKFFMERRRDESTMTKLLREADVVGLGTLQGVADHGQKALTDPATLLKFGTSALLAGGLTVMQGKKGWAKLSAQAVSLSFTGAFVKDVYQHGDQTLRVIENTWDNPQNLNENRKHIADTLGPFVVDFGIFTAGGITGIGGGKQIAKRYYNENPIYMSRSKPAGATLHGEQSQMGGLGESIMVNKHQRRGSLSTALLNETKPLPVQEPVIAVDKPVIPGGTSKEAAATIAPAKIEPVAVAPTAAPKVQAETIPAAGEVLPYRANAVEFPVVEMGMRKPTLQQFPADAPIARAYAAAQQSVGRIEVLAVEGDALAARVANATYIGEGRLVTNHHTVQNAADITIIDPTGKPHKAYTIAQDAVPDLAILQLRDPQSASAFKAPVLKEGQFTYKGSEEGQIVAIGHYAGENKLHASPGTLLPDHNQSAVDLRFKAAIEGGNCGGPVMNMNGEVLGFVKSGRQSMNASPVWHINRMLGGERIPAPSTVSLPRQPKTMMSVFEVADAQAAKGNVNKLFGDALAGNPEPQFFHSKAKRVSVPDATGKPQELILQAQISPATHEVTVQPFAYKGQPLTAEITWPGTDIPIATSRLTLKFDPKLTKAEMSSVNDPKNILREAFNYRGENNYLATRPEAK